MKWEIEESIYEWLPRGEYFRSTGVFRTSFESGLEIAGVSVNSWEEYLVYLSRLSPTDKYVVSPELITCAGMKFDELDREKINKRIENVVDFSGKFSKSYFLLGTPLFVNERPRNSVIIINNGEIIGVTNKRIGATDEEIRFFEMVPEETPLLLPGSNVPVVICSDLALASLFSEQYTDQLNEILRLSGKSDLIGRAVSVLPKEARSVLVIACWAVGGRFVEEVTKDQYYKNQLVGISARIMKNTSVKEIIVVDRILTNLTEEKMRLTPTRPYNGVLKKKN